MLSRVIKSVQQKLAGPRATLAAASKRVMGASTSATSPPSPANRRSSLDETFEVEQGERGVLGAGAFGTVRHARRRRDGQSVAVKTLRASRFRNEEVTLPIRVVEGSRRRGGVTRNVLSIEGVYWGEGDGDGDGGNKAVGNEGAKEEGEYSNVHVAMELLQGCELFQRVLDVGALSEREAQDVTLLMAEAVEACHKEGIAHLDIKPENFCFRSEFAGAGEGSGEGGELASEGELTSEQLGLCGSENDLVLIDFGSAVVTRAELGMAVGEEIVGEDFAAKVVQELGHEAGEFGLGWGRGERGREGGSEGGRDRRERETERQRDGDR